jgi:HEPN domain-containing protein
MNEAEHLMETRRWLRYAREDLQGAEMLLVQRGVVPRHICWLAQQAAEKTLKAILVFLTVDFPRRHDPDALRNLVPDDWQVKTAHADLAALTEWALFDY